MKSVSSRIWTHVAVSISYDDNHYTTDMFGYVTLPILVTQTKINGAGDVIKRWRWVHNQEKNQTRDHKKHHSLYFKLPQDRFQIRKMWSGIF